MPNNRFLAALWIGRDDVPGAHFLDRRRHTGRELVNREQLLVFVIEFARVGESECGQFRQDRVGRRTEASGQGVTKRSSRNQQPRQKGRLLNFLLSNCSWENGEVVATFRQPFDRLAEIAAIAENQKATATGLSARTEIWLPDLGSNQGPAD